MIINEYKECKMNAYDISKVVEELQSISDYTIRFIPTQGYYVCEDEANDHSLMVGDYGDWIVDLKSSVARCNAILDSGTWTI